MDTPLDDHELGDIFVGSRALKAGAVSVADLRSRRVVRVLRGVYRQVAVADSHVTKCRAAGLLAPSAARFTGRSAATVLGCELASASDDVELLLPTGVKFGPYSGIRIRRVSGSALADGEAIRGLALASDQRVAFDLAARHPLPDAVAHLDAFIRHRRLHLPAFRSWLDQRRWHDVVAVRDAAALVDPRAESPQESRLRVILHLAGIDLEPQYEVRHRGHFVARVDLADTHRRVAVEYDGTWHALREQLERDRRRLNDLQAAGWSVVHVTGAMLRRPRDVVDEVERALIENGRRFSRS